MSKVLNTTTLRQLHGEIEQRLPDFLADLESLVNIESGSFTKAGVDAVVTWMGHRLSALGAAVERHAGEDLGDTLVATFEGAADGPTILLIGHADTVFDAGFLARRPYEIDGDIIRGPGVSDMKGGLLSGLYAIAAVREVLGDDPPYRRLVYVVNPDEEIGSPSSTGIIRDMAAAADVAFVMESARADGDIVSARKGVMDFRATLHGRAAHAGVEPHKGRSATLEAAHKTVALHALNGRWPGVTVNVGEVRGGTRPNIVAEEAVLTIDMRARTQQEQDEAAAAIRSILESTTVPDVSTHVETLAHWPPMEKSPGSARLVEVALDIAGQLGFTLADVATGGGSDANTTTAAGVPSLDGLGPIGGNDHTAQEYIELSSIVPRTTLLAGLLLSVTV